MHGNCRLSRVTLADAFKEEEGLVNDFLQAWQPVFVQSNGLDSTVAIWQSRQILERLPESYSAVKALIWTKTSRQDNCNLHNPVCTLLGQCGRHRCLLFARRRLPCLCQAAASMCLTCLLARGAVRQCWHASFAGACRAACMCDLCVAHSSYLGQGWCLSTAHLVPTDDLSRV